MLPLRSCAHALPRQKPFHMHRPACLGERLEAGVGCQHRRARRRVSAGRRQLIRHQSKVIELGIPALRSAHSAGVQGGQAAAAQGARGQGRVDASGAGKRRQGGRAEAHAESAAAVLPACAPPRSSAHPMRAMHWYRAALGASAVTGLSDRRASLRAGKQSSWSTAAQPPRRLPPSSSACSAVKPAAGGAEGWWSWAGGGGASRSLQQLQIGGHANAGCKPLAQDSALRAHRQCTPPQSAGSR